MAIRRRTRRTQEQTDEHAWLERRDEVMARYIWMGLGIRPHEWWLFESGRLDLDDPRTGLAFDVHGHIEPRDHRFDRVQARFRYLVESGELTDEERDRIVSGRGHEQTSSEALEWRRWIIEETEN